MGLFTPKWKKSEDGAKEALETAEKYGDCGTMNKLALQCGYPRYRAAAIRAMEKLTRSSNPEGREAETDLKNIAVHGVTAHDRCLAAVLSGDKKLQSQVFKQDLAEANRERPELDWLEHITVQAQIASLYPAGPYLNETKRTVLNRLTDMHILQLLAERERDGSMLSLIVGKLDREHLLDTIEHSKNAPVKKRAVSALARLDPALCAEKYFSQLSGEELADAVRKNAVPRDKLVSVAQTYWPERLGEDAAMKLQEPADAIAVLRSHRGPDYDCDKRIPAVYAHLIQIARKDPDALTDLVMDDCSSLPRSVAKHIVRETEDDALLYRIACSDREDVALAAADALKPDYYGPLTENAKCPAVVRAVTSRQDTALIPDAEPEQLLGIYIRSRENGAVYPAGQACLRLPCAEALRALAAEEDAGFRTLLLERVTDGQALLEFYLSRPPVLDKEILLKLRGFTGTDPAIAEKLTEALSKPLQTGDRSCAEILAFYHNISLPEAEWTYGGPAYVRLLTIALENDANLQRTREVSERLGKIYRVSESSRKHLEHLRGKSYRRHSDVTYTSCGVSHEDSGITVTNDWTL